MTSTSGIQERSIGCMLMGCIGDVLGSQTEGMTSKQIKTNFPEGVFTLPQGKRYTDDGEMTIALAEYLCDEKSKSIDMYKLHKNYYAPKLVNNRGYSGTTHNILKSLANGETRSVGTSDHNGAIMRISPLALVCHNIPDDEFFQMILCSLYFTHATEKACNTAFVHCRFLSYLIRNANTLTRNDFITFVTDLSRAYEPLFVKVNIVRLLLKSTDYHNITEELTGNANTFQIKAIDCFCCALYNFLFFWGEPIRALEASASMGGDTDTIAKVTGDMCGATYGLGCIPSVWRGIEDEAKICMLADSLYQKTLV